jgi:hypothetical protein
LWDDKTNVENFLQKVKKINEMSVLENPLNKRLRLHHPSIKNGVFTPNAGKPDQHVSLLQRDVQFQPRVKGHQQILTLDEITATVEDRLKQLTTAVLKEAPRFLALTEQEQHIVNMFDMRSFNFHNHLFLREQFNNAFLAFASHLNNGKLSFPRERCGESVYWNKMFLPFRAVHSFQRKERVRDNKERFEDAWFTKNEAGQVKWNISVLTYFQKTEFGLYEHIPDVVEMLEICLIM